MTSQRWQHRAGGPGDEGIAARRGPGRPGGHDGEHDRPPPRRPHDGDVVGGPITPAATPAPVRLIAGYDNLVLSHADRSRVLSARARQHLYARANVFPGTVPVDGFAAGTWRLSRSPGAAALTVELCEPVPATGEAGLRREGEALLASAAPAAAHHLSISRV